MASGEALRRTSSPILGFPEIDIRGWAAAVAVAAGGQNAVVAAVAARFDVEGKHK